jgi:hypothetical protein
LKTVTTINLHAAIRTCRSQLFLEQSSRKEMSNDCAIVVDLWKHFGRTTTVDQNNATACCYLLGASAQPSGIEGVTCTSDGKVTEISWPLKNLSGTIPNSIRNLNNLSVL